MFEMAAARQAQDNEAGEWRRFEKAPARRLDCRQNLQCSVACQISRGSSEWIARGQMMMSGLTDADKRRERIADDRQAQHGEESMRHRRELERQRQHPFPRARAGAQPAAQRAGR